MKNRFKGLVFTINDINYVITDLPVNKSNLLTVSSTINPHFTNVIEFNNFYLAKSIDEVKNNLLLFNTVELDLKEVTVNFDNKHIDLLHYERKMSEFDTFLSNAVIHNSPNITETNTEVKVNKIGRPKKTGNSKATLSTLPIQIKNIIVQKLYSFNDDDKLVKMLSLTDSEFKNIVLSKRLQKITRISDRYTPGELDTIKLCKNYKISTQEIADLLNRTKAAITFQLSTL